MDKNKINKIFSSVAMVFALFVLGKVVYERFSAPAGTCPINNNSPLIIIALVLLIGSLLFELIIVKKKIEKE